MDIAQGCDLTPIIGNLSLSEKLYENKPSFRVIAD